MANIRGQYILNNANYVRSACVYFIKLKYDLFDDMHCMTNNLSDVFADFEFGNDKQAQQWKRKAAHVPSTAKLARKFVKKAQQISDKVDTMPFAYMLRSIR